MSSLNFLISSIHLHKHSLPWKKLYVQYHTNYTTKYSSFKEALNTKCPNGHHGDFRKTRHKKQITSTQVSFCCILTSFLSSGSLAKGVERYIFVTIFLSGRSLYKFVSNFSGIQKFGFIRCMIVMKECFPNNGWYENKK